MTRSVYIVDDHDGVRTSLHCLMTLRSDQIVRSFSSGDQFLEDADSVDPGVLLLDVHMPGTSGVEVLETLRRLYPGKFASLILTGAAYLDLAVRAMEAGALDFLEKPNDPQMLLGTIDAAFSSVADGAAAERATEARAKIDRLTRREREVLKCLIEGCANKVIATALNISSRTVEICRANLMTKLSVPSLSAALRIAFAAGMFPQAHRMAEISAAA